jgi:hypothetical protein
MEQIYSSYIKRIHLRARACGSASFGNSRPVKAFGRNIPKYFATRADLSIRDYFCLDAHARALSNTHIQVSRQRYGFSCAVAEADFALMRNNRSAQLDCLHPRLRARSNNASAFCPTICLSDSYGAIRSEVIVWARKVLPNRHHHG